MHPEFGKSPANRSPPGAMEHDPTDGTRADVTLLLLTAEVTFERSKQPVLEE